MTRKRQYLAALSQQPTVWLIASARNPSPYMTRIDIALHYIVLRDRGIAR